MSFWSDMRDTAGNLAKAAAKATKGLADSNGPETTGTIRGDSKPVIELPTEDQDEALLWDPYAVIDQLGYKDRPSPISYNMLEAIVWKVPSIQAIILTRLNQLDRFCKPRQNMFDPCFRVTPKERDVKLTAADRKYVAKLEDMLLYTGVREYPRECDHLSNFVKKVMRDSMMYDQLCAKIVRNRKGKPAQFYAVDASSIRLANSPIVNYRKDKNRDKVHTVQIYDGVVIKEWNYEDMVFGVRNPHSSIRLNGYGVSEAEMLVEAITALLWGFDYNKKFFSQGSVAKGLLNIKGAINKQELKALRRQWYQMISGIQNAFRTPIINTPDGGEVQWLNMHQSNRDMEYSAWIDFLLKVVTAVYQIDPMEIGFKYGNSGQDKAMFETGNTGKLVASKDKGLAPMLTFLGRILTSYIVRPIDPDFCVEFVGLETHSKDDLAKLNQTRVKTIHTVNELREEQDLEPLEDGDIILDSTYLQYKQSKEQAAMMEAQGDQVSEEGQGSEMNRSEEGGDGGDEFSAEDFKSLISQTGKEPQPMKKSMGGPIRIVVEV